MRELEYKIYGLRLIGEEQICYVGRTMDILSTRWSKHKTNARLSKTNNHRSNWMNKHKDNIEIFLIEGGIKTKEESCEREIYYIALYREKYGSLTNCTNGGDGGCEGYKHTEEAKTKISKAHKGKKLSEEHIKNLKNKVITEETRKKLSITSKRYILEHGNPMTGKKRPDNVQRNKDRAGIKASEETKAKMSEMRKGEGNYNSKLNIKDVKKVKKMYATGNYSYRKIGEIYGVSKTCISCIVLGMSWKD